MTEIVGLVTLVRLCTHKTRRSQPIQNSIIPNSICHRRIDKCRFTSPTFQQCTTPCINALTVLQEDIRYHNLPQPNSSRILAIHGSPNCELELQTETANSASILKKNGELKGVGASEVSFPAGHTKGSILQK